ncbi:MAG: hypothetical protein AVDCRST_MAG77-5341 [uncultured Chloroflexi bacterium]|uniref:SnoaL-like domain-containing protein n=1 Tax=uncultured Chloroflexota bacterium TaxID=166587 RepID=A0A6J4K923_9CHLR|nr:MAG: hypothetical protein AVDCRST_MAG77-5341 [uncultured Chloroflexota bacterium]
MSAEENRAVIGRVFEEVLNRQNVDVIDELFAADLVNHSAWPGQATGPAGTKQAVAEVLAVFPDLHVTVEALVAEGD